METITIKDDVITKTITHIDTYSKKALEAELSEIEKELKEVEKQPDELMLPNDSKMVRIEELEREAEDIKSKLSVK